MNNLDVSVIIPYYNALDTFEKCLDSAASQIPPPKDIFVIDDGSEISPKIIIDKISLKYKVEIKLIYQNNKGASAARNVGVFSSTSKYLAFLDADDIWFPNKLLLQYNAMETYNWIISGHKYIFDFNNREFNNDDIGDIKYKTIKKWRFIFGNPYFTPTVMVLRHTFSGFDDRLLRVDDYKAWIENFSDNRFGYIEKTFASGFKPPIGHSGLTASLDLMHKSLIYVLILLYRERYIGKLFFILSLSIEYIKFPIRKIRKFIS